MAARKKRKAPKKTAPRKKATKAKAKRKPASKKKATATKPAAVPAKPSKQRDAWDRQPGEPDKAFEAFGHYLRLKAHERNVLRASDNGGGEVSEERRKMGRGPAQWEKWSAQWHWVSRASQYDDHLHSIEIEERDRITRSKAAEHHQRMFDLNEKLFDRIQQMLKVPLTRQKIEKPVQGDDGKTIVQKITIEPVRWSMSDMLKAVEVFDKAQRLLIGEPTERLESNEIETQRLEILLADPETRAALQLVAEKTSGIIDAEPVDSSAG